MMEVLHSFSQYKSPSWALKLTSNSLRPFFSISYSFPLHLFHCSLSIYFLPRLLSLFLSLLFHSFFPFFLYALYFFFPLFLFCSLLSLFFSSSILLYLFPPLLFSFTPLLIFSSLLLFLSFFFFSFFLLLHLFYLASRRAWWKFMSSGTPITSAISIMTLQK